MWPLKPQGYFPSVILKKRKFRVYFNQVNQSKFEVEATSEQDAIQRARIQWRQMYGEPSGARVEGQE